MNVDVSVNLLENRALATVHQNGKLTLFVGQDRITVSEERWSEFVDKVERAYCVIDRVKADISEG